MLSGDPPDQEAVRVVGQVIPHQGVEQVLVGTEVGDRDGDELAVAGRRGVHGGAAQPRFRVCADEGRGHQQRG